MWLDTKYSKSLTNFQNCWTYNSFIGELNPTQILIDLNPDGQNNSWKCSMFLVRVKTLAKKYQTSLKCILETLDAFSRVICPSFNWIFEAFKFPQFNFQNLDMMHGCNATNYKHYSRAVTISYSCWQIRTLCCDCHDRLVLAFIHMIVQCVLRCCATCIGILF